MSVRVKQYEAINGTTIISISVSDILALGGGGGRGKELFLIQNTILLFQKALELCFRIRYWILFAYLIYPL